MCGILLVKSKHHISLAQHKQALSRLNRRGPDFARYRYTGNIFIGQTVLHITGNRDYYSLEQTNFLAYNGEIYNYQELGNYSNDIEFVHDAVETNVARLKQGWGPWAWAWTNGQTVRYATDPQGERCLYQYQDTDILIVSSEIAPIREYVDLTKKDVPYLNKTWTMLEQTPWQGVTKIEPGVLYQDGEFVEVIDSIWSWIDQPEFNSINEAYEEFTYRWNQVTQQMRPGCPAALTYSGGLDSSIILSHIPDLELYSVNTQGKDPIVDRITDFLNAQEQSRLHLFQISEQQWAQELRDMIQHTGMPAQSWSFVGQWIAIRHCQQRVIFTGTGADELFGGYDMYRDIKYSEQGSSSPFSKNGDRRLWLQCLAAYDYDVQQATMLMDYWYQVVGCDARAVDTITGCWGIEARNPFLARPIMQLALNLPAKFKIGWVSKPLIRRLFLQRWSQDLILPKKGFSGHANDALPWLNISITPTGDRMADWRQIAQETFYAGT
jgi:asparagine synthetase B (glutamine-hydrolysing)